MKFHCDIQWEQSLIIKSSAPPKVETYPDQEITILEIPIIQRSNTKAILGLGKEKEKEFTMKEEPDLFQVHLHTNRKINQLKNQLHHFHLELKSKGLKHQNTQHQFQVQVNTI